MCVLPRAFRPVSRTGNSPRSFYFLSRLTGKPILGLVGICLVSGLVPHGPAGADTDLMALTPEVTRSLLQHPEVAEANARVCQSIHRLGLSKAEARPQLGLEISGGRQIVERVKGEGGRPDNRGPSESGTDPNRTDILGRPIALADDEISGAHKRDYAHRSRDNIYDGTLSVRYQQAIGSAELARLAAEARKSDLQGKQREMESLTDNFKAEAAAQLVEAKTKAAQYLSRQEALRGKVRHAEIRAPLSGTVSAVHVKTIGAVVQAGTVLVDIVPAESVLLARAQVLPQHVAAVRPGQIARLSVSAYDPSRYGVLMGVVQRVATNTTQPENQMPYYETIIEIPEVRLTKSGIQPEITPGMPLTVDILGDKRTVMNYIITPIEKSWKSAFREQ